MQRIRKGFDKRFIEETGLPRGQISRLVDLEKRLSKYNEQECSEPLTDLQIKAMERHRADAIAEVHAILGDKVTTVKINTDPRGPAIRMVMASGWYNCPDQTLALELEDT